jgi:hypothetical protein
VCVAFSWYGFLPCVPGACSFCPVWSDLRMMIAGVRCLLGSSWYDFLPCPWRAFLPSLLVRFPDDRGDGAVGWVSGTFLPFSLFALSFPLRTGLCPVSRWFLSPSHRAVLGLTLGCLPFAPVCDRSHVGFFPLRTGLCRSHVGFSLRTGLRRVSRWVFTPDFVWFCSSSHRSVLGLLLGV